MQRSRFHLAPVVLAMALAFGAQVGHAQIEAPVSVDIVSQPLGLALNELARQLRIDLIVDPELVAGKTAPAVSGSFTPRQAMERLLADSGLTAVVQGGAMVVRRGPTAASQTTLPQVVAKAGAESPVGPVPGYAARRSTTGTKTDTPTIETPQSITIVGAEQITAQKPQNITEALGYSAGVFRSEDLDATRDQMRVRGFDLDAEYGSYYRDGLKYTVNGFNGQQELYGLERVELLRGAASLLYGVSAPGGLVNTVSKRPTKDPIRELNAEVGSFDRKQVSGDFSGAFSPDSDLTYRLTALGRDSNTFVDHIQSDRVYVAPALKWEPSLRTSLTILSEYQKDETAYNSGLPANGTLLSNPNGQLPRSRFLGTPGFDKADNDRYSVGYLFEHAFSDALKLRNSARYFHNKNDYASTGLNPTLQVDDRTIGRSSNYRFDRSQATTADLSLEYKWGTGAVVHTTLAGIDYTRSSHRSERYSGTATSIDVYNPDVNNSVGSTFNPDGSSGETSIKRAGLYVQEQAKIAERWVVSAGLRQDWVSTDQCGIFSGTCTANDEKSNALTGRVGAVYLAGNGLAPFMSYSTSWEPVNGLADGARAKPTEGEQVEAGLRYQPVGRDATFSANVYRLKRTNVVLYDPNNSYQATQIGHQVSKGVELEAQGRVGRHLNLVAAYAYTDAMAYNKNGAPGLGYPVVGAERAGGVPYNQFSAWMDYSFGGFDLPGLTAGGGVRYVDETQGIFHYPVTNEFLSTPSYTLLDLMVSYTTGPWRIALNITNATDKEYVAMCPYRCFYGEPRKTILSGTYRW